MIRTKLLIYIPSQSFTHPKYQDFIIVYLYYYPKIIKIDQEHIFSCVFCEISKRLLNAVQNGANFCFNMLNAKIRVLFVSFLDSDQQVSIFENSNFLFIQSKLELNSSYSNYLPLILAFLDVHVCVCVPVRLTEEVGRVRRGKYHCTQGAESQKLSGTMKGSGNCSCCLGQDEAAQCCGTVLEVRVCDCAGQEVGQGQEYECED